MLLLVLYVEEKTSWAIKIEAAAVYSCRGAETLINGRPETDGQTDRRTDGQTDRRTDESISQQECKDSQLSHMALMLRMYISLFL